MRSPRDVVDALLRRVAEDLHARAVEKWPDEEAQLARERSLLTSDDEEDEP